MIIRMHHVRRAGYCSEGLRQFAIANNLDWMKFLKEGISSDELAKIGDAQINRIIRMAEKEQDGI